MASVQSRLLRPTEVATTLAILLIGAAPAHADDVDRLRNRCEHGVTLALLGRTAQAESLFVSLLAESPGDAGALNNLGNIRFLCGEPDVAAAFYAMAAARDTADAGILLNRATALMVQGEAAESRKEAARAIRLAGGLAAAAQLLGLERIDAPDGADKAAHAPAVSGEEVRAMLARALENVPPGSADSSGTAGSDSLRAAQGDSTIVSAAGRPASTPPAPRAQVWRTAGPRASEAGASPDILYWKR